MHFNLKFMSAGRHGASAGAPVHYRCSPHLQSDAVTFCLSVTDKNHARISNTWSGLDQLFTWLRYIICTTPGTCTLCRGDVGIKFCSLANTACIHAQCITQMVQLWNLGVKLITKVTHGSRNKGMGWHHTWIYGQSQTMSLLFELQVASTRVQWKIQVSSDQKSSHHQEGQLHPINHTRLPI